MKSLFRVNFPWAFYAILLFIIRIVWLDLSIFSFLALAITLHQFLLVFFGMGNIVPIRYIAGVFMCLQMLLGPTFAYNGLDAYVRNTYQMKIPEAEYFAYILPAISAFIIGLHITAGNLKGEILNEKAITSFVDKSNNIPYIFIGAGFLSSFVANFFGSELGFVFYLVGNFKYIGAFMLLYSSKQLKIGTLVLVYGSIIVSSLGRAMFHDLLTWLIMLGAVVAIRYKFSLRTKAIGTAIFILFAVVLQQLKGDYREETQTGDGAGLDTIEKIYEEKSEKNSIFGFESLAKSNVRINQGFIVTNIMNTVPAMVPYANGAELMQILEAAFLPRILAPDKLNAGDRQIFMKYSGMRIRKGTSMGLSSMGDAYINFGVIGGCIFMFFLGLLFSETLNGFHKYSAKMPVLLLFTPLIFYYPIRPDCELQTSLGHLVKASFLIFLIMSLWKSQFTVKKQQVLEPSLG